MQCFQCKSTETYIMSNGNPDWRQYKGQTYCKICYRRIMSRLANLYPETYYCECGCGGALKNNHIELARFIRGHQVRGERHPKWDHTKPFVSTDYTLAVKKNLT